MPDVEAHITGTVWKVEVAVGDQVDEGDTVVILESMKMEMPVEAEDPGKVAEIRVEEGQIALLEHAAFAEMLGRPGAAILDFAHREAPYYGHVVSTFPLLEGRPYTPQQLAVILDLPPGTRTQRSLIYAVRIHPDGPASTKGSFDPYLAEEARRHSEHQARIQRQGHHNWERRFHRINAKLPPGLLAREVCAESWPGETLVDAAEECVRCWRLSSGHWSAVSASHDAYAYL